MSGWQVRAVASTGRNVAQFDYSSQKEKTKRHDGLTRAGRPYSVDEESLETDVDYAGTVFLSRRK